ncbi:MAG: hypothetical protein QM796_08940 [Chthoniobacteraceae bacterium]
MIFPQPDVILISIRSTKENTMSEETPINDTPGTAHLHAEASEKFESSKAHAKQAAEDLKSAANAKASESPFRGGSEGTGTPQGRRKKFTATIAPGRGRCARMANSMCAKTPPRRC